ncbi:MAG: 16S rRNA processing protein RimM [Treponema sp.]|nr:MAG: 16S rRNA processing protein RimM [Treponema sp.]
MRLRVKPANDTHLKFSTDNLLATAKIHGTFGLDGFVKTESFSGEFEHFLGLEQVFLEFPKKKISGSFFSDDWYELEEVRTRHSDVLFKFKGIDSVEKAKSLKNACVYIPRDKAPRLKEGEFYANDLCNCVLVCENTAIGRITSVVEGGSSFLLELSEAETGRKVFVPFNSEFIGKVDTEAGTVELMHRWILE